MSTMAASTTSIAYWPVSPRARRREDLPIVAAFSSDAELPSTSPVSAATRSSTRVAPGIVDPPVEDGELQRGDEQGDEEQPDRVHRADGDVVGPVEALDLVDQRLGGPHRTAL